MAKLEQNVANKMNETGGNILCMDTPKKLYFGIDYISFETGDKFKGVKMLPPGAHFIYTSVDGVTRTGIFLWINSKQTMFYEWHKKFEFLIEYGDKDQAERLAIGMYFNNTCFLLISFILAQTVCYPVLLFVFVVFIIYIGVSNHDFDCNLGAYPINSYQKWQRLSCYISQQLIQRLSPVRPKQNKSNNSIEMDATDDVNNSIDDNKNNGKKKEKKRENDKNENDSDIKMDRELSKEQVLKSDSKDIDVLNEKFGEKYDSAQKAYSQLHVFYSQIPSVNDYVLIKMKENENNNQELNKNSEITKLNMDKTEILEYIVKCNTENGSNWDEICGEIQYSFIQFFIGQSVQALEQWKKMVDLLCHCDQIIETKPNFYSKFLQTLYFQLNQLPNDWFKDEISKSNFLNHSLQSLFEIISESTLTSQIQKHIEEIKSLLKTKFDKKFELNNSESAPMFVDAPKIPS